MDSVKVVETKGITKVKDELEYATNWRRGFVSLYTKFKWLKAFTSINKEAVIQTKDRFLKQCFSISDNIIDKNIENFLND